MGYRLVSRCVSHMAHVNSSYVAPKRVKGYIVFPEQRKQIRLVFPINGVVHVLNNAGLDVALGVTNGKVFVELRN